MKRSSAAISGAQLEIKVQKTFSMDAFKDNLLAAFTARSGGFSYGILQDGQVQWSDAVGSRFC